MKRMVRSAARRVGSALGKNVEESIAEIRSEQKMIRQEIESLRLELIQIDRSKTGQVLRTSETEIATRIFSGMYMYLDPRDIAVVPHIVFSGIWEESVTKAWINVLNKPDAVVFDIGANFGYFGLLAAQRLDLKRSKTILFEANPSLVSYIQKTLSVNWLNENTLIENMAIADKSGISTLKVLKDYVGSSSLHSTERLTSYLGHKMDIETEAEIKVSSISVDDYCEQHAIKSIDLIKMDIEGFEEKAYAGMSNMVASSPNLIFFIEFTKDGYERPERFYNKMKEDFTHMYLIDEMGGLFAPDNAGYADVIVNNSSDWVMLVFSKKELLS